MPAGPIKKTKLDGAEEKQLVRLICESLDITDAADFRQWVTTGLRKLFPHGMLICGAVQVASRGRANLLSVDFPLEYIQAIEKREGAFNCPTLMAWFTNPRPQFFAPDGNPSRRKPWPPEFNQFDLRNVASHGVMDAQRRSASYFSFSQIPETLTARHAYLLQLLAPHLHQAYVKVTQDTRLAGGVAVGKDEPALSAQEITLLHWITQAKTNWEIARILDRNQHTVKHEVSAILAKLNVATRLQAATKAVDLGLVAR